jgi:hypothetical protein
LSCTVQYQPRTTTDILYAGRVLVHTFAPSILPLLEAPEEDSFGIILSSAVAFDLISPMVAKYVPLWLIFRAGTDKIHSERGPKCTVVG